MTTPPTTLAVLGGRGMLGTDLALTAKAYGFNVRIFDLPEFNITNANHLAAALVDVDAAVNCAAFTNVDLAEDNPDLAHAVNATAVGTLGTLCKERGIHLTHISTDFVFDGEKSQAYNEDDCPNPINVYGATKLAGEHALLESEADPLIVRVEWSYGGNGTNFIIKLLERAAQSNEIKVVCDQTGAPTWTKDMAQSIIALIKKGSTGLYHFANKGYASRCDVAVFIAQTLNLTNTIIPCSSSEFPMKARRPKNSCFDTTRIQAALNEPIRSWQDALRDFLLIKHEKNAN